MASVSTNRQNKSRMILFVGPDKRRHRIRLGKVTKKQADAAKGYIEDLVACKLTGEAMSRATADWLARISPVARERIERTGLIEPQVCRGGMALDEWLRQHIQSRKGIIATRTEENCEQARKNLLECFGADKPLASFTAGDGDEFRLFLVRKKLAEGTIRRRCGRARQFFTAALKHDLIDMNPFDGVPCKSVANPSRFHYVTRAEAEKVLDACPDVEWRLIFALSRFGGLRCPSETLSLRWGDIDWAHNRMRVPSPKTAHLPGRESRLIPLFPELQPLLQEAFEEAEPGSEYVISRYRRKRANLRTGLTRIIRAAGLEPWEKLFQNCRSTRQTELGDDHPPHVVCAWIGNSEPVAMKHYLQVREEDFRRATEKAAHKAAQHTSELGCRTVQRGREHHREQQECEALRNETALCGCTEPSPTPLRGVEPRSPG